MSTDDQTTPITGPIPIYVKAIPGGAALDLSAFAALVVGDVLDQLLNPEDTHVWDRLHELAEGEPATDGRLPFEELVADLAERCSSRVPLYGPAALELTRRLAVAVAPRAVPQQIRRAV
jgi:hypothetical protein